MSGAQTYQQTYHITSSHNKTFRSDLQLKTRRARDSLSMLTVEGYGELRSVLNSGVSVNSVERVYLCPDYLKNSEESLLARFNETTIFQIPPRLMNKISYRQHPDAWLAVIRWNPLPLQELPIHEPGEELGEKLGARGLYLITEDLEKPGNVGALLRSADGAGARALIVARTASRETAKQETANPRAASRTRTDPRAASRTGTNPRAASAAGTDLRNPNVVRASKGALFSFPCAEADNRHILQWLEKHNIPVVIADPSGRENLWSAPLPSTLALILGSENRGLSQFWKSAADMHISIPMFGNMDSLNVAQAGTLIMYELLRRRTPHDSIFR
ncbi:MAG: TrmH family RNA methyltransferase [Salinispira sp.]